MMHALGKQMGSRTTSRTAPGKEVVDAIQPGFLFSTASRSATGPPGVGALEHVSLALV